MAYAACSTHTGPGVGRTAWTITRPFLGRTGFAVYSVDAHCPGFSGYPNASAIEHTNRCIRHRCVRQYLPEEQALGEAWVRQAVENMPAGDQAAVVLFGENALVERLANEEKTLADLTSVPVTTRTDIASALQLALALFPNEGAGRIVLLSDGRENLEAAQRQADLAATQGIELQYVPLGKSEGQQEVLLDSVEVPAESREGQQFELGINIQSSVRQKQPFGFSQTTFYFKPRITVAARQEPLPDPHPGCFYRFPPLPCADHA